MYGVRVYYLYQFDSRGCFYDLLGDPSGLLGILGATLISDDSLSLKMHIMHNEVTKLSQSEETSWLKLGQQQQ